MEFDKIQTRACIRRNSAKIELACAVDGRFMARQSEGGEAGVARYAGKGCIGFAAWMYLYVGFVHAQSGTLRFGGDRTVSRAP
jgi:hypothetical protein